MTIYYQGINIEPGIPIGFDILAYVPLHLGPSAATEIYGQVHEGRFGVIVFELRVILEIGVVGMETVVNSNPVRGLVKNWSHRCTQHSQVLILVIEYIYRIKPVGIIQGRIDNLVGTLILPNIGLIDIATGLGAIYRFGTIVQDLTP